MNFTILTTDICTNKNLSMKMKCAKFSGISPIKDRSHIVAFAVPVCHTVKVKVKECENRTSIWIFLES